MRRRPPQVTLTDQRYTHTTLFRSRGKEKHAPADGWAPVANALGCECPPASADGRRLLLDFAPKGIRTRVPTCSATHKRGAGALLSSKPVIRARRGLQA